MAAKRDIDRPDTNILNVNPTLGIILDQVTNWLSLINDTPTATSPVFLPRP